MSSKFAQTLYFPLEPARRWPRSLLWLLAVLYGVPLVVAPYFAQTLLLMLVVIVLAASTVMFWRAFRWQRKDETGWRLLLDSNDVFRLQREAESSEHSTELSLLNHFACRFFVLLRLKPENENAASVLIGAWALSPAEFHHLRLRMKY